MRQKVFAAFGSFIIAAALVVSGACDFLKGEGPTSPSPGNGSQPPDSGGNPPPGVSYPPLPHIERLIAADGTETKMWVELVNVDPSRGSFIILGPPAGIPDCSRGACFRRTFRFGLDELPNPATMAGFEGFFSEDRENPRKRLFSLGGIKTGTVYTSDSGNSFEVFPDFAPKYILVSGRHPGQVNGVGEDFLEGVGNAKFLVDYKPRP